MVSSILASKFLHDERLQRARNYLENGIYIDGSFGSTLPYAGPDIDDTAVALIGLKNSVQIKPYKQFDT